MPRTSPPVFAKSGVLWSQILGVAVGSRSNVPAQSSFLAPLEGGVRSVLLELKVPGLLRPPSGLATTISSASCELGSAPCSMPPDGGPPKLLLDPLGSAPHRRGDSQKQNECQRSQHGDSRKKLVLVVGLPNGAGGTREPYARTIVSS